MAHRYDAKKFTLDHVRSTAERCENWGKWGPDDEIGTLNYITEEDIQAAAKLVRKGKVFSLGLNFDREGPQKASPYTEVGPSRQRGMEPEAAEISR